MDLLTGSPLELSFQIHVPRISTYVHPIDVLAYIFIESSTYALLIPSVKLNKIRHLTLQTTIGVNISGLEVCKKI